jgi:prepilin-type N-terminal cleavage/methylation domain-containing protein
MTSPHFLLPNANMNRTGITLIELSLVIAIIAIGAALLSPNMGEWIHHYRLKSATRDIVSLMRVAQIKAVSTYCSYRIRFDQEEGTYLLERYTGKEWMAEGTSRKFPKGVAIFNLEPDHFSAKFNPNATCSSGSITLKTGKGFRKRIALTSATGRIRVE